MRALLKNQKGFTIIELMIALFITALAISGYIGANVVIQRNSEEAFERTVATQDSHRVIERMRSAAQTGTFPGNVTAGFPQNGLVAGFANLNGEQIQVNYVSTTANPLDATVTVTWTSNSGRVSTTALRTLITQR